MWEALEQALVLLLRGTAGDRTRSLPREQFVVDMALRRRRRTWMSVARTQQELAARQVKPRTPPPPRTLERVATVSSSSVSGWLLHLLTPRAQPQGAQAGVVVYLHGGGFVQGISHIHWGLVKELLVRTGASVVVPRYPLAPRGTAGTVVPVMAELVRGVMDLWGPQQVSVIGDSAGGNLVLATAQQLRDAGHPLPRRHVLICPSMDMTCSDPRVPAISARDPFLSLAGVRYAGLLWAGDLAMNHPLVNPLYGDLAGLPPLVVFSGTRDICYPDSLRLVDKARDVGLEITHHELVEGVHDYPLLPTPEGRVARDVIAGLLTEPR